MIFIAIRQGAEIVIALTHMRMSSDTILAEKTQGVIDLVLGGRNHAYETKQVCACMDM